MRGPSPGSPGSCPGIRVSPTGSPAAGGSTSPRGWRWGTRNWPIWTGLDPSPLIRILAPAREAPDLQAVQLTSARPGGGSMQARCVVGVVGLLLVPRHMPEGLVTGPFRGAGLGHRMPSASQGVALVGTAAAEVAAAIPEPLRVLRGTVGRRDTLGSALRQHLSPAMIHAVVEAARPVHDLARISVGHPFGLTIGPDGILAAFTYGIDELRTLRVV